MLVLQLKDGSPYVFPTYSQMQQEILDMAKNTPLPPDLVEELTALVEINSAELSRLNYLLSLIALRLKPLQAVRAVPSDGSAPDSLAKAEANLETDSGASGDIFSFINTNQSNPSLGIVQATATGKQAFNTIEIKVASDLLDVDRAEFFDGRARFWVREMQLAQKWINTRITYANTTYSVQPPPNINPYTGQVV